MRWAPQVQQSGSTTLGDDNFRLAATIIWHHAAGCTALIGHEKPRHDNVRANSVAKCSRGTQCKSEFRRQVLEPHWLQKVSTFDLLWLLCQDGS